MPKWVDDQGNEVKDPEILKQLNAEQDKPAQKPADSSQQGSWYGDLAYGFGQGALGDVVGAAELAGTVPYVGAPFRSALQSGLGRQAEQFVNRPSTSRWQTLGSIAGSAAPFEFIPGGPAAAAVRYGAKYAPRIAELAKNALMGAGMGAIQPTGESNFSEHLHNAEWGAGASAALGRLGKYARDNQYLQAFNKKALDLIGSYLTPHGFKPSGKVGPEAIDDLDSFIKSMKNQYPAKPAGPERQAADQAGQLLNTFKRSSTQGLTDPHRLAAAFEGQGQFRRNPLYEHARTERDRRAPGLPEQSKARLHAAAMAGGTAAHAAHVPYVGYGLHRLAHALPHGKGPILPKPGPITSTANTARRAAAAAAGQASANAERLYVSPQREDDNERTPSQ